MAFDIASVLGGIAAEENGREQITYLDISLITPDEGNFYSMDGIEELAGNIELIGLQQPLRVRKARGDDGYILVSGHRRREAILRILADRPDAFPHGIPCIIEEGAESEAMRELRLIYANAATRTMNAADLSRQAERVEALLYQLKEEGVEFPGRMRDHVAEACRVSKTKLARLHAIRTRLDPVLLVYFDRGELTETAAYELSRLPDEAQAMAGEWLVSGKRTLMPSAVVVERVNRNLERYQADLPCRAHAGGPDCHHKNEKILRSIFAPYEWQVCVSGICCRDCYHGKDCSRACQECKDRRKLEKDVEKEKEAERKKSEESAQLIYRKLRQKQAKRLLPLIEAAGLSDYEAMPATYPWTDGPKVGKIRKAAAGDFGDDHFHQSSWSFRPDSVSGVKAWAKKLGCSTDFLLELTDDPKPKPAKVSEPDTGAKAGAKTEVTWQTGTPAEAGEYVIRCGVPAEEKAGSMIKSIKEWNGEAWTDSKGVPLRLNVYGWIRLPEV